LPGGDAAVREPRRAALGLLHELFGDDVFHRPDLPVPEAFSHAELTTLRTMLARGVNTPLCCSVGRLFDAVAALTGVRQKLGFEGQAAMELEFAAGRAATDAAYGWRISSNAAGLTLDWAELICGVLSDVAQGVSVETVAAKFHHALAEVIVTVARRTGCERVALSGGCFQNRYLTERAVSRLHAAGFQPYWHQRIPPNDGGIALGQVVAARRELSLRRTVALEHVNRNAAAAATSAAPLAGRGWSAEPDRVPGQTVAQPV
jgi:hydrogenase maturation protein HypF